MSTLHRKLYLRGYRYGRRNVPWSMLPNHSKAFGMGWGAGQQWLYKHTETP